MPFLFSTLIKYVPLLNSLVLSGNSSDISETLYSIFVIILPEISITVILFCPATVGLICKISFLLSVGVLTDGNCFRFVKTQTGRPFCSMNNRPYKSATQQKLNSSNAAWLTKTKKI